MSDSIPSKSCNVCGEVFPATSEYFYKSKKGLYGLRSDCKKCHSIKQGHKPKVNLNIPAGMKRCPECKQNYPATNEYFHNSSSHKSGLAPRCKQCAIAVSQARYAIHTEEIKERTRQWWHVKADEINQQRRDERANLPDDIRDELKRQRREKYANSPDAKRESDRQYAKRARDKIRRRQKQWEHENPEKKTAIGHRYRAKKRELPYDFTGDDWQRCLEYWQHRCAFCGRVADESCKIVLEHVIPISDKRQDNPGTIPTNIVPACHGVGGCNNEKHNIEVSVWLTRKFGAQRAAEILARIAEYFEFVASNP